MLLADHCQVNWYEAAKQFDPDVKKASFRTFISRSIEKLEAAKGGSVNAKPAASGKALGDLDRSGRTRCGGALRRGSYLGQSGCTRGREVLLPRGACRRVSLLVSRKGGRCARLLRLHIADLAR